MNCELCGREVQGEIVVGERELTDGTPVITMNSTANRDWICCDSCNALVCHPCCHYPDSGYCDVCIEKYQMYEYLKEVGLIKEKGGCECL